MCGLPGIWSPYFLVGLRTLTLGLENLGLQTLTLKNLDSNNGPKMRLRLRITV